MVTGMVAEWCYSDRRAHWLLEATRSAFDSLRCIGTQLRRTLCV